MAQNPPSFMEVWTDVCAEAWQNPDFKARLKANPDEVLGERGFPPPEGMHFDITENAPRQMILVLPAPREEVDHIPGAAGNDVVNQYYAICV